MRAAGSSVEVPPSTAIVYEFIRQGAENAPEAPALIAPGRSPLSYSELLRQIESTAVALAEFGVRRDDTVAVVLPNGPEMAACFLGVTSCAAIAPLNPAYAEPEMAFYLSDLDAKVLIVPEDDASSPAVAAASELGIPVIRLRAAHDGPAGWFELEGRRNGSTHRDYSTADDVALVLHTSGTTARPKRVPLTHRNLATSARNVARALHLTPDDRCLNVMPMFHIHGLVAGLLATLSSGGSVVCPPGFYAPRFFSWLQEFRPTWYTAVPTMHQAILGRAERDFTPSSGSTLRLIRSSSSSLPPQVMGELERVFGVPVVEAYGMTEAAHQIASNPLPPGRRMPGSVGRSAGPEVAIMDGSGTLLQTGQTGEIVIRGINITPGYANNPEANQAAFTEGWFRTGDEGHIDDEGYLFISGRIKEIINRGGEKISPREIDEVLLDHPAVSQAQAFAVPDARLGEDVAAVVVLKDGEHATEGQIRAFAAARLALFKVPRRILIREKIPTGPTGKVQRISLAERLGVGASGPDGDASKPNAEVTEAVAGIWNAVLGIDDIDVHSDFLDLGGDSMLAGLICARVNDRFGIDLPIIEFFDAPTVSHQAVLIQRYLSR